MDFWLKAGRRRRHRRRRTRAHRFGHVTGGRGGITLTLSCPLQLVVHCSKAQLKQKMEPRIQLILQIQIQASPYF